MRQNYIQNHLSKIVTTKRIYNETLPHVDDDIIVNLNMGIIDVQNVKERGQLSTLFFYLYYHDYIRVSSKAKNCITLQQHKQYRGKESRYVCYWTTEIVTLIDYDNTISPYDDNSILVKSELITALNHYTTTYNIKYYTQTNV